jgi:serine/threonine-protein kinase
VTRPGDTFGRYAIDVLLGEGGMGRVYRALDTRLERRVALKILRSPEELRRAVGESSGDTWSDAPARLLREARAAAALEHPNAVAIFDVGDVDGVPYIAMELVEGRALRSFVGDESVPLDRRVSWLVDVARALGAAHERGLIHRDIKPENVMVRADGVAKVLDFGIARRVAIAGADGHSGSEDGRPITAAGKMVGTPLYMAPEQLRGDVVDGRADQFAWGVVAYELLAGAPPWNRNASGIKLLSEILSSEPAPLSSRCPSLPAAVVATVHKALGKSPRDRFESMGDVVAALEPHGVRSQREVVAVDSTEPPPPPSSRARLPPAREPGRVVEGAATRKRWTWPVLAIGALAAVVVMSSLALRRAGGAAPASEAASIETVVSATTTTLAITDPPPPRTANPDALAAYLAGLQSLRDASISAGIANLERAVAADRSLAAAHVRLAWLYAVSGQVADARTHFQSARELRATLSERDQAYLEAAEPLVVPDPPDPSEAERRMVASALRWPGDAELAFVLGRDRLLVGRHAEAKEAFDRAIASDPRFALVWWARGIDAEDAGDVQGALDAYDACVATSAAAASCLRSRSIFFAQRGECARLEADARTMTAIEPNGHRPYEFLARALAARGRPAGAVREALAQRWANYPADRRAARELGDRALLALAEGDFAGAEALASRLQTLLAPAKTELEHVEPVRLLLDVYEETGDAKRAAKVADDFRARHEAWIGKPAMGEGALDGTWPRILALSRRAGSLPAAAYAAARDEWLRTARATLSPSWTRELWVPAYAVPAESPEEGREAVDALPAFLPLPPARELTLIDGAAGKVLLLAGRDGDALPFLRRAAASCLVLDDPVGHTRAHAALGQALEATGDVPGACAAWRVVVDRWGAAKPRSRSADRARERLRALRCP